MEVLSSFLLAVGIFILAPALVGFGIVASTMLLGSRGEGGRWGVATARMKSTSQPKAR